MPEKLVKLDILEKQTFEEDDSFELPPSDIIAYNELRSCADLFRMYNSEILDIQPGFQREIVWKNMAQTRFIDSLVKQLPIPSMCFSLDYKTQKWQVIDGLQRMYTIIRFLKGETWTLAKLDDIDPSISGQSVSKFVDRNSDLYSYYTRIENLTLPITVIRCDYSKSSHANYLFTIFHRLNKGAMTLTNQEIRNCIFSGPFNNFLKELDEERLWLSINKRQRSSGYRYRGQEQILRMFAFQDGYKGYDGRLAHYLNGYMQEHRRPANEFLEAKKDIFERTLRIIHNSVFEGRSRERPSISVLEATLVGVSLNLDFLETQPDAKIREMYFNLLREEEFSEERLSEGLSGKTRVIGRMSTAEKAFSGR